MKSLWVIILLSSIIANKYVAGEAPGLTNMKLPTKRIAIINLNKNQICSGEINLKVRVPDQGTEGERLTVYVDGQVCSSGAFRATPTSQGFIALVSVPTDAYINGWHELTVYSGSQRTRLHVKFMNDISEIRLADIANPFALITAKNISKQAWTIKIISTDSYQSAIRVFHGQSEIIRAKWDGKDSYGKDTPDDTYQISLTVGRDKPHLRTIYKSSPVSTNGV